MLLITLLSLIGLIGGGANIAEGFWSWAGPTSTPIVDGIIAPGEWGGATSVAFPYSSIYVFNDDSHLYLLIDLFGDTVADPGGDSFMVFFDLDDDGQITPNSDMAYTLEDHYLVLSLYRSSGVLGQWEAASRSQVGEGFGPSTALGHAYPKYGFPHRIWELAISLEELGIGTGDSLGFGVKITSRNPRLSYGDPFDFSHLIHGRLEGFRPFAIIGELDWLETSSLSRNSHEYMRSRSVALLKLPQGEWCTSFLVAQDILWTSTHCLGGLAERGGTLEAVFNWEKGVPEYEREAFVCDEVLASWPAPGAMWRANAWDVTLLRCRPGPINAGFSQLPGDRWGVLQLCDEDIEAKEPIYLIHQNECWGASPSCEARRKLTDPDANPSKKISFGVIADPHFQRDLFTHDADTLGGSSGAPVFDPQSGYVIGYHRGYVRGRDLNGATAIEEIRPALEREGLWAIISHC